MTSPYGVLGDSGTRNGHRAGDAFDGRHPDDPGPIEPLDDLGGVMPSAVPPHKQTDEEETPEVLDVDQLPPLKLANLPADFWEARRALEHIRQAAHSRSRSADLVFHAALARLSGMLHPELRFDTGLGPGSLNYFVAGVAGSGIGKSAAAVVARELIRVPAHLRRDAEDGRPLFCDGLPLGSGEGIAEAFMGWVRREVPGTTTKSGTPRMEKARAQVRHNAFFSIDEGETLTKVGERAGATVGPTIRSAWIGELLGQANATEERARIIPAGSYSLGLLIGYQPETAAPLLADAGPGTPQRFLWCSALDTAVPRTRIGHPGPLDLPLDTLGGPMTGVMQAVEEIRDEVWSSSVDRVHGTVDVAPLDSHEPYMRSKIASLLALLDGRDHISAEDWQLSRVAWDTSCAVRDALVSHGVAQRARHQEERTREFVDRQVRAEAAVGSVPHAVQRIAERLARKAAEDGGLTNGAAWRSLSGRDRKGGRELLEAALEHGAAEGLFLRGQHGITPTLRAV